MKDIMNEIISKRLVGDTRLDGTFYYVEDCNLIVEIEGDVEMHKAITVTCHAHFTTSRRSKRYTKEPLLGLWQDLDEDALVITKTQAMLLLL